MYRRAQTLLLACAVGIGLATVIVSQMIGKPMHDPEGFLGPTWLRLPLLVAVGILVDLVPYAAWRARGSLSVMRPLIAERWRTHWTRERFTLVALGIACFYLVYVCYRNLKSFLPFVVPEGHDYDHELHLIDHAILFGHDPGILLNDIFGHGVMAWLFSGVYLWFLPLVPFTVVVWLVWPRNLMHGYWYVSAQVIAWTLGTVSYYCLPTVGPGLAFPYLYADQPNTPARELMQSLVFTRQHVLFDVNTNVVQSVAGFASLHCAITLLVALMVQATWQNNWLRAFFWVNFGLTVLSTLYFGWHYISDDVAGVTIALVSYYVGGVVAGHRFQRKARGAQAEVLAESSESVPA
ncbi:MAG: phosphatase PAP2 family protein [Nocardioides sp.]|nr:phosphatase PAP2 family protein [Nocardioides sp.]